MRWKRKFKRGYRARGWAHPPDYLMNQNGVWAGSSFYGGVDRDQLGADIPNRRTEWLLGEGLNDFTFAGANPNELIPYTKKELQLNLMQYWNGIAGFDSIGFPCSLADFNAVTPNFHITYDRKRSNNNIKQPKNHKWCFVYAIDNPEYDGTNPQVPPCIYSEPSDWFMVYPKVESGSFVRMSVRVGHTWTGIN